jgi:uncharacterized phage protein (TIGR01671 family)
MNREIKFRGKSLRNGEWLYGDLMHDNIGGSYVYPIDAENLYKENEVSPDTVGQYTGLKDKNGVEIYEGDIIMFRNFGAVFVWYNTKRCSFELRVYVSAGGFIDILKDFKTDLYEVVGNIYDNPELINKEEKQ